MCSQTEAKQDAIKAVIAAEAGVDVSYVQLTIAAASVSITVRITVPVAGASNTVSTLTDGIFSNTTALETALAAGGVPGLTVAAIPALPVLPCDRPCAGATCAAAQALPCAHLELVGCDCGTCCQRPSDSTPQLPDLCGSDLQWDPVSKQCQIVCGAAP